ncbi:Phospholipase D alpha 1 [Glycine soja]
MSNHVQKGRSNLIVNNIMRHLLHGRLDVIIREIDTLPSLNEWNFNLCCKFVETGLYATVDLDEARVGRTKLLNDQSSNPTWNETFHIYCAHLISYVIFTVKQKDPIDATLIGRAYVPVEQVLRALVDRWFQILDENLRWFCAMDLLVKWKTLDPMKPRTRITLGELPKMKAEEGVKVLMLVWDDRTSVLDFKKNGLMAAHDQETADYFKNKKVNCVLCPRNPDDGKSIVQVVDSQVAGAATGQQGQKRTILSFVGGIDLCDGRYDIQEHPLFSTLDTVHKDDFHQPNFSGASIKKGSVAWDVLLNFQQRWEKQVGNQLLFSSSKLDEYFVPRSTVATTNENETWNVQLFRSIDGGAASGFPQDPEDAAELGLVSGKDNITDRSIHDAYINAIRRAKNFIYTENHFVRSSHGWQAYEIGIDIRKNPNPTLIKDKIKIEYISERLEGALKFPFVHVIVIFEASFLNHSMISARTSINAYLWICSTLVLSDSRLHGSRGCLGCFPNPKGHATNKDNRSEDFWSSSAFEIDQSALQSQKSISSIGIPSDPQSSADIQIDSSEYMRRQWVGNRRHENKKQVGEPIISWNATYESLMGTNKPFPRPIPLGEMVDFLVDIWEMEGLYD